MSLPGPAELLEVLEATWPAAHRFRVGPWTIRDGAGGGQRVSAATAEAPWTEADLALAEAEMAALGQSPLFMIRGGEETLDAALAARGYAVKDPVVLYAVPLAELSAEPVPRLTAFTVWPPLAIAREIWQQGGIGPARCAVMERAAGPKTAVLGRTQDRASGAAFAAIHGRHAMLHTIEVVPALRRNRTGLHMIRAAAHWARSEGAETLSLAVTRANAPANALYAFLGMSPVGYYHYRVKQGLGAT
jgi:GNAT superfamily N-acetyltransferase